MAATLFSSLLVLLQLMCGIVVVACLLTRSKFFLPVPDVIRASRKLPATEIMTAIPDTVQSFCGNYPLSDDITLRVIRVK